MKLRPFELVLVVVFGVLFILALILLRTYNPPPDEGVTSIGTINIWGVLPEIVFNSMLDKIKTADQGYNNVRYRYIPVEDFNDTFVNALADQKGPDLIFVPHDMLVTHRSRLQPITYESFPVRDFRSTYIDGATIFALNNGLYGFPVTVDPLVLYWNRDIFATNGFLVAPSTWEEVVGEIVPTLTARDFNRNIQLSALAMGEYQNIKNSFPLLSLLLLQGGSKLVTEENNQYGVRLNESLTSASARPFENAVTFFTNFSNNSNTLYSWNRSLPLDRDMFLSGDLAMYFGFASEGRELEEKNPNLSFDVAEVPQGAAATVKRTYGRYYSLMMTKTSDNKASAFTVMQTLTNQVNAKQLADGYNMVPAHRSALQLGSNDIYGRIAYTSATYARGWLSPDIVGLDSILMKLLDDISSNRKDITPAVNDAVGRIQQIY